jgi:hypothetical protein
MNYTQVINPAWANAEHTAINCDVDFDDLNESLVPFTADPTDPYNPASKEIFDACVAGTYGEVAEYVAPVIHEPTQAPQPTKEELMAQIQALAAKVQAME